LYIQELFEIVQKKSEYFRVELGTASTSIRSGQTLLASAPRSDHDDGKLL